jgi:rod shape-determining protein MreC
VTDTGFAAGVESQKNHVHGVLKGLGTSSARVDFVPTGQKVEVGEVFYTSGEDRVFPKGLPVGKVTSVKDGSNGQDITVEPSGAESAPEEVLVILDPVHQAIPEAPSTETPEFLAPDVDPADQKQPAGGVGLTAADKLRDQYKKIGDAQNHVFGEGNPGTLPPNFNLKVPGVNAPAAPPPAGTAAAKTPTTAPPTSGTQGAPQKTVPPSVNSTVPSVPAPRPPVPASTSTTGTQNAPQKTAPAIVKPTVPPAPVTRPPVDKQPDTKEPPL